MNVMQSMDNLMKPIPSEIKILYDALLVKKGVLLTESLLHFIKKLKVKNQTEQQQKQAFYAISIFSGIKNTDQDEIGALKNKKENISTKKTCVKSNSADWRPVYQNFDSEIKLRHYSSKTLEVYRGWSDNCRGLPEAKILNCYPQPHRSTSIGILLFHNTK